MAASAQNQSFEAVVLPHLDAAHNLARWLMRDATAAEDVLQEAMVRALTYFPGFRGVNPRGWLLQIVRNAAYGSMKLNRGIELVPIANGEVGAGFVVDDLFGLCRGSRGRTSEEEITIFKSVGLAIEDLAIANALVRAHSD